MGTRASSSRPPVRVLRLLTLVALLLPALADSALADWRTQRLRGDDPWLPEFVRTDESLVSLRPVREAGRLRAPERKVREEVVVDLEAGLVRVQRYYGTGAEAVPLAPEYVQDLRRATLAAAARASRLEWISTVRERSLRPPQGPDAGIVSIAIPVDLPDALADVIGEGARLNLTGQERITFSGTSNIVEGGPQYESGNPSAFPDLDMKQQLRVNLDGTIGRKIHVLVNHDSEVDTDFENKIQLRYDGDEDEVVQKIEMGNTDLSLPGAEFLSFRKSQQGLFGAKALAKLGNLDLTIIASKQEGKTATQNFVGRARRDSLRIRDVDFVKRRYYWVAPPAEVGERLPIRSFELFLDDKIQGNDNADNAVIGFGYADALTGTPDDSTGVHRGFYSRLQTNVDYQFDPQTGVLILERSLSREQALACTYEFGPVGSPTIVGDLANPDTLSLQLLAPPEQELWDDARGFAGIRVLEQRNVYFLGARNIVADSFELAIRRKGSAAGQQDRDTQADPANPGGPEVEFIRVLGLDYRGVTSADPDLKPEPEFVDFEDGTLTFPNLTPFAPDSSRYVVDGDTVVVNVIVSPDQVGTGRTGDDPPLAEYNSAIYSREPDELFNQDKYYLEVRYTTPTPTYSLNRFNILEGSERVRLNGRLLSRGAEYDIDYDFGIITFRTPDASQPDAEIEVDFEYVPLFGQAKESLVGVSGTYNFGPRTWLSSSWLFFTRATPEERPKLGQEPSRILVGNLYGQWIANPGAMTDLVNAIPFVRTEDESELEIQGEVALSLPNPNTKNQIYIDDMEGVEDSRELSITRGVWVPASEPEGPEDWNGFDLKKSPSTPDGADAIRPLPFNWYNPENVVRRRDVFLELSDEREGQDFLQVLEMAVREDAPADSGDWVGVMRNLSTTGEDYAEKKFLEVWINDFGARTGRLVVDLGEISEDFYVRPNALDMQKGRGYLDTEDTEPLGGDGELNVGREDFGLDNVKGIDGQGVPGDDGDDDFFFDRPRDPTDYRAYDAINNYEGNSLLDTEDLDGDRLLDTDDAYFSYVFDLSQEDDSDWEETGVALNNDRIDDGVTNGSNPWRLFRIRLDEGVRVGGVPRLRSIKYARVWLDGLEGTAGRKAQIAQVKIVGAAWIEERQSTNDRVEPVAQGDERGFFGISVKNNKEDVNYVPPFDPGEDQNNEQKREQSLAMEYRDLPSSGPGGGGRQGSAYKEILDTGQGRSQDYTQYESLSFYLRDGRRREDPGASPSGGTFFLRFGPDTTNFYEFSTRRHATDPSASWSEVYVTLNELAELKLDPPETTRIVEGYEVDYRHTVVDGDTLAVYGAPSLTRVRRLTIGVKGDDPLAPEIDGEIWLDEIRLRSVKKDVGYASRVSGAARFADFMNVSGAARAIDSEFRRIEGDRHENDERSWSVRGDMKLNKFVDGLGISLPVTADYTFSETTPRLAPNSDIQLEDPDDRARARTTSRRHSFSSRFAKTRPSRNPFLRYTVDNFSVSGTMSRNRSRSPFLVQDGRTTTGQATYNLSPGQGASFRLLNRLDVSYLPALRLGVNGSLNQAATADVREDELGQLFEQARDPVRTRTLEGTLGLQWDPVRSNSFDSAFRFNKRQDFDQSKGVPLWESVKKGGRELRRDHNSRLSWRPGLVRWLRPVVTYDTDYQEDQGPGVQAPDLQSRPDSLGGPIRVFRVQNTNTREFSTTLSLRQLFTRRSTGGRDDAARRRSVQGRSWRDQAEAGDRAVEGNRTGKEGEEGDGGDGDAEKEGDGKEDGGFLPDFGKIRDGVARAAQIFGDVRYSYTDRRSSRYSRVTDRPGLAYQLGLKDFDLGLVSPLTGSGGNLIEDNTEATYTSEVKSSLAPTSTLYMDGSWRRAIGSRLLNGTRNKTDDVTFPDFSVNLDGLEGRRFLQRWAKTSSLNTGYRRQTRRQGKLTDEVTDPDSPWWDTQEVRTEFSPLVSWSTSWKSGVNTTFAIQNAETVSESDFRDVVSRTVTTSDSWRLNGRYSFSAPNGITVLGRRLRFQSDLTLNFDVSRGEEKSVERTIRNGIAGEPTTRSHQRTFALNPRATYNFSRKIQGSLDMSYRKTERVTQGRTDKVISVAIEALIKF